MRSHRIFVLFVAAAAVSAACTSDGTTASTSAGSAAVTEPSPTSPPSGPGTNGKIAFYRDFEGVMTIDPDGTHEEPIGADLVLQSGEAWSPDSSKLLVLRFLEEGARPATINPDGSDLTLLNHYPDLKQHLGCGFWSPDATRFLCGTIEDPEPVNGIYTLRSADGGGLRQIMTTGEGCVRGGSCIEVIPGGYSADGSLILFNKQERNTHLGNLFVVKPDGTDLRQLSPSKLLTPEGDYDWSRDGSQVAFGASSAPSTGGDAGSAVFVINADGTGLRRITPFSLGAYSVRWSPDGQLIAFSNAEPPLDSQIYVVAPDGTGLLQLTEPVDGVESFGPEWSPDSTKLAFQSWTAPESEGGHNDLWTVNADGTGLFQLTSAPNIENTLNWGSAPVG